MAGYEISIVMPALNEEANVERAVIETARKIVRSGVVRQRVQREGPSIMLPCQPGNSRSTGSAGGGDIQEGVDWRSKRGVDLGDVNRDVGAAPGCAGGTGRTRDRVDTGGLAEGHDHGGVCRRGEGE